MTGGSSQNVVSGNYIGLNRPGTAAIGNGRYGIFISSTGTTQNAIGGGSAAARNVISGNGGDGIQVHTGSSANQIVGNYVGTDVTGNVDLGNNGRGVYIGSGSNNVIGDVNGNGNLISGNSVGIQVDSSSNVQIVNNLVGVNAAGTGALGNQQQGILVQNSSAATVRLNFVSANGGNGIELAASVSGASVRRNTIGMPNGSATALANRGHGILISGSSNNTIGSATDGAEGNVIWGNGANGIAVVAPATGNAIRRNSLLGNTLRGIDLANNGVTANDVGDADTGANNLQNFPVLATAPGGIQGTLNSRPSLTYTVEYFINENCDPSGNGEGESLVGSVSVATDANGNATLPVFPIGAGVLITATATSPTGDTSEFSACVTSGASNDPPVASAGADQSVNAGNVVQLSGIASSDPDSDPLTYTWTFVTRPSGSSAALSNATTPTPTFTADFPGLYTVRLVVNDGTIDSAPDDVDIHTNGPPIANAGSDQTVPVGSTVQLDGIDSSDPENSPLTYTWFLNTRPPGSAATLSNSEIRNPTFVADLPGMYAAQLVVNDGLVNSASDLVIIRTANRPPVANAGSDIANVPLNTPVSLSGSASADPDGDAITYSWAFVQRPSGSAAALLNANTASPSFTVDIAGRYRVRLTVNDGQVSGSDEVDVTTVNVPPVANAGPDQTVHEGDVVTLNGSGSSDQNGNDLSYQWSFVSRPQGSTAQLSAAGVVAPTFTADVAGVYTLQLIVNDTIVDGAADTVVVTALSNHVMLALVNTPLVGVGTQASLRVLLPFEAPPGGVTVSLTSSDSGVATVSPATVTVAAGGNEGQVTVNGLSVGTTTLTAVAPGYADGTLDIAVTNNILSVPASLTVPLGGTTSLPVIVSSPAPPGGLLVSLVSSNPAAVELLTGTITIPAGAVGANATISGSAPGTATVVASSPNFASASAQTTTQGNLNITVSSIQIRPAFPSTVTVDLQSAGSPVAAPAPGVPVSFAAGVPGCAAIAAVTIPTGLTSATAAVTYGGSATLPCTTTVNATAPDLTGDSISVTVNPNPGITLLNLPGLVGGGLMTSGFTARLAESNHGGVTVRITSSNPNVLLVSPNTTTAGTPFVDIPVANGSIDASFVIQGVEGAQGTVTLTATAPGFTQAQGTATVGDVGLQLSGLSTAPTTLSPNDEFSVNIGVLNASGGLRKYPGVAGWRTERDGDRQPHEHRGRPAGHDQRSESVAHRDDCRGAVEFADHGRCRRCGLRPDWRGLDDRHRNGGRLPGGATRDGNRERAGHNAAEPAGAGGRRSDDGRLRGAAGSHGARRRDGADHEQQPERAAGVAQHDDGGHAVRGYSGGERQHRRQFRHSGRGRGPGNGDADGDGTRFHAGAEHGDGR